MIKLLIGGSPCTFWSICQSKNRETKAEGIGWELFKNFVIAKEKFKPDLFLYENNWSASKEIKEQIQEELDCELMRINSKLVSAQNRDRFYVFNWNVEQPEDRGILLRDILETGEPWRDKSPCIDANYFKGGCAKTLGHQSGDRLMVAEPLTTTSDGKSFCITATEYKGSNPKQSIEKHRRTMIAEPVRVPNYGEIDKSRPLSASYANKGSGEGSLKCDAFPDNPNKQVFDYVAEPIRIGDLPNNIGKISGSQATRIYDVNGKSVNLVANGGGQGAKTGLYAVPINDTAEGKSQTIKSQYAQTSIVNICCYKSTYGATGVASLTEEDPDPFLGDPKEKDSNSINRIYEVRDGMIAIKGKTYPIKLKDGHYIIRKLTPVECERLQTLPDGYTAFGAVENNEDNQKKYRTKLKKGIAWVREETNQICFPVADTNRYKGCGNGWTAEVIIHILQGALKDVPKDEKIMVLSMYDGIGTGRYCIDKMGFTNVEYHAYEIDKYAIKAAMNNYPDIIQHGDAFQIRSRDWRI